MSQRPPQQSSPRQNRPLISGGGFILPPDFFLSRQPRWLTPDVYADLSSVWLERPYFLAAVGKRKENNQDDQQKNPENHDASFWSGCPSAQNQFAHRMSRHQMVLRHEAAVRDAINERLRPVPRSVEANRPP